MLKLRPSPGASSETRGVDKPTIREVTLYLGAHTSRSSASLSTKSRAIRLVTTTTTRPDAVPLELRAAVLLYYLTE